VIVAFLILAAICAALIGLCLRLLGQLDTQAKEHALERGALLQRIQAPERAVAAFAPRREHVPARPVVLDDDAAMAEALGDPLELEDDDDAA
jgi:hypothetical protein